MSRLTWLRGSQTLKRTRKRTDAELLMPLVPHLFPTCLPLVSHLSSTCLPLVSLLRPSCLLLVSHFFSACRPLFSTCLPLVPHLFPTAGSCWVSIFTHCVAVPPSSGMRRVPRTSELCLPLCLPLCVSNFFSGVTHQEHWNLVCYCVFHLSPNLFATVFRIVSPTLSRTCLSASLPPCVAPCLPHRTLEPLLPLCLPACLPLYVALCLGTFFFVNSNPSMADQKSWSTLIRLDCYSKIVVKT